MQPNAGLLAGAHKIHIDHRRGQKRLPIRARIAMANRRLVARRQPVGDQAAQRQTIGLHARRGQEHDGVTLLHRAGDALRLGPNPPHRRTGQHNGVGLDDAAQSRRLAATPDRARLAAALGPAVHQRLHARRVGKPIRLPHRRVHGHRDRQRAAGHQIVDDGGHRVDGNLAVKVLAGLGVDRIGHQIFGAQAFFHMGQKVVVGLHQVAALAARVSGFGVTVGAQERGRGARGLLAGALECVKLVVVDAGRFVAQGHGPSIAGQGGGERPGLSLTP